MYIGFVVFLILVPVDVIFLSSKEEGNSGLIAGEYSVLKNG
jgi:hypothetical protein